MAKIVVGLVGPMVSGKNAPAEYLIGLGFSYQRLSDLLREEARRMGVEISRSNLQNIGNKLRAIHGNEVLAKLAVEKMRRQNSDSMVVEGIRNLGELFYLREELGAFIVGIDASYERRLEWYLERARQRGEDPASEEAFAIANARDRGESTENGQQVALCLKNADVVIQNDGDESDLLDKFSRIFTELVSGKEGRKKRLELDM